MSNIIEIRHPLVQHHLCRLRDRVTSPMEFRASLHRLSTLLAYEATHDLSVCGNSPNCTTYDESRNGDWWGYGRWLSRQYAIGEALPPSVSLLMNVPIPTFPIYGYSGKCIDVRGAGQVSGTVVQTWSCVGVPNQQWAFSPIAAGTTKFGRLMDINSRQCLSVAGGSPAEGAALVLSDCNTWTGLWSFTRDGEISNVTVSFQGQNWFSPTINSGSLCIASAGATAGDGTPLELVACGHDARQQWGYGEPAPPPLP